MNTPFIPKPKINEDLQRIIEDTQREIRDAFYMNDESMGRRKMFERGDEVFHRPSGETWVVKRAGEDSDGEFVEPAGWPPCRARAGDCEARDLCRSSL